MELQKTSLRLKKDLWQRAKIQAVRDEIDLGTLIERALEEYLSRLARYPKPTVKKAVKS